MTILLRFQVFGKTVTIFETNREIDIEFCGVENEAQKRAIQHYITEEGILDEILEGNYKFPQTTAETLLNRPREGCTKGKSRNRPTTH